MRRKAEKLLDKAERLRGAPGPRRAAQVGWRIDKIICDEEPAVRMAILVGMVARFIYSLPPDGREDFLRVLTDGAIGVVEAMELKRDRSRSTH